MPDVYKHCKKCGKETRRTNRGDDCRDCVNKRNLEYRRQRGAQPRDFHGHSRSNTKGGKSRVYSSWMSIKQRCYYENSPSYKNYGAKGIKMCSEWKNSFSSFLLGVGEPPEGDYVLSRKQDKGDYVPGNCEWKLRAVNTAEREAAKGESVHTAKLCRTAVIAIRQLRRGGATYKDIAEEFKVHPSTVGRIIKNVTWAHVV